MALSKSGSGKGPDGPETSLRDDSRSRRILAREDLADLIVRTALAIRRVLLAMPISIQLDDLTVGNFRVVRRGHAHLPKYTKAGKNVGLGGAHQTADYQTLVNVGLKGLRAKAQAALQRLGRDDRPDAEHRKGFYKGIIVCCDAVRDFAWRYAALAAQLGAGESDVKRAAELRMIAQVADTDEVSSSQPWFSGREVLRKEIDMARHLSRTSV